MCPTIRLTFSVIPQLQPNTWSSSALLYFWSGTVDLPFPPSELGQGLHTTGIVGFAFASLDMIMSEERHAGIFNKAKEALAKIDANANPGLVKQYELTLERMELGKGGSPGCEFISFPGLLSGPSESRFTKMWDLS